jgi:hypothetical protein
MFINILTSCCNQQIELFAIFLYPVIKPSEIHYTFQCHFCSVTADTYGQAASNLVAGNNLEQTIQQIMDMGGGSWDRDTVNRALRAAFNNPERAVDYLYSVCLNCSL